MMERRLAAILLTDMIGYSRLMGLDEQGTIARQKAHREEIFDPNISAHGGRIVKTTGDWLLVEFRSVVDAVKCAVEMQRKLTARDSDVPEERRIRYRIGINLGDIVIDGDDILGDGVNVAARLEALAKRGGVCISGTVYEHLAGKTDIVFKDAGEQTVKNIPLSVRVWHWQTDAAAHRSNDVDASLPLPNKPPIAVLPFENLSSDPEQDYLADGIVDDVITGLSKFRSLFVIARSSSFLFKGGATDVRRIASELGVRYVLEGSLRKAGDRVRVTGQLVDAETGKHMWADRFDGQLKDLFVVQDQITNSIIKAIEPEIGKAERDRARRKPPESLDAWSLYQRALAAYFETREEKLVEATTLFDHLNEVDPGFAPGFAMAADTRSRLVVHYRSNSAPDLLMEASKKATIALALDAEDPVSLWADGRLKTMCHEYDRAVPQIKRAIALNPNYAMAYHALGFVLTRFGDSERAIEQQDTAIRLSPNDAFMSGFCSVKADCLLRLGRYEEARITAYQAIGSPNPRYWAYACLAAAAAELGRQDEARRAAADLMALKPDFLEHVKLLAHSGQEHWVQLFQKNGLLSK